jgi:hypothetical protein
MTDDQRFSARRPDVLVFETAVLEDNVTSAGDILVTSSNHRNRCGLGCESD